MIRWYHKTVAIFAATVPEIGDKLDEHSLDGWEFVQLSELPAFGAYVAVFKRAYKVET